MNARIMAALPALLVPAVMAMAADDRGNEAPLVGDWPTERTVYRPVPLRAVKLAGFLGAHVDANNRRSIPAAMKSPVPAAFEARSRGEEPPESCRRLATDSDFFKWLEGACYAIAYDSSLTDLKAAVDRYADMLVSLQQPDGYLGTGLSPAKPFDDKVRHDLYVAGHLIEAAVAHHKATGETKLLDAARRFADFYLRAYEQKHPYFETVGTREHPEIELALVRLYRATGDRRYLDFSAAITRMSTLAPKVADLHAGGGKRHAVRLCYLLAGCTELFFETADASFTEHVRPLWNEIVSTRMYITGGIGRNEGLPATPYDLPPCLDDNPNRDIAETCASVAMMMFSWRMHGLTGESRYFDTIETILYNHYMGAVSPDHLGIFYYNPLTRVGDMTGRTDHAGNPVRRTYLPEIHSTTCCFPNSWRFYGQLPELAFSAADDGLLVNLYTDASIRHVLRSNTPIVLEMQTGYPREERVEITVRPGTPARFALSLRIPAWCEKASVTVADAAPVVAAPGEYHRVERHWQDGDRVVLDLDMRPVVLFSHPAVSATRGQAAFRRGPVVYCLEKQDAAGIDLQRAAVGLDPQDTARSVTAKLDLDLGMYLLEVPLVEREAAGATAALYTPDPRYPPADIRRATLIPFHYRANREPDSRWITFIPAE